MPSWLASYVEVFCIFTYELPKKEKENALMGRIFAQTNQTQFSKWIQINSIDHVKE